MEWLRQFYKVKLCLRVWGGTVAYVKEKNCVKWCHTAAELHCGSGSGSGSNLWVLMICLSVLKESKSVMESSWMIFKSWRLHLTIKQQMSVCPLHVSRTVHQVFFTLFRFDVDGPTEAQWQIWCKFYKQTIQCEPEPQCPGFHLSTDWSWAHLSWVSRHKQEGDQRGATS